MRVNVFLVILVALRSEGVRSGGDHNKIIYFFLITDYTDLNLAVAIVRVDTNHGMRVTVMIFVVFFVPALCPS